MAIEKLKDAHVRNAKIPEGAKTYLSDGNCLYLCVRKAGSKQWVYIWTRYGRRKEIGLGGYPAISLRQAREAAAIIRQQIGDGLDPLQEKRRDAPKTFGEVTDLMIAKLAKNWVKPKDGAGWRRMAKKTKAVRKIPIAEIAARDFVAILQPVIDRTPETGRRLRAMCERVMDYGTAQGWREGDNPARLKGNLEYMLSFSKDEEKGHFEAMPYDLLPKFWKELEKREANSARALAFTILTAGRTSEILEAKWSEIDFEAREWTIPAPRMKKRKEHIVPLSDAAIDVLRPIYELRWSDYIFAGQNAHKPLSNMAMLMLMRRMAKNDPNSVAGAYTVHGMRSAFKDWASDKTGFADDVSEFALAHSIPDATKAAYRRLTALDKRAQLMQQWSDYCQGIQPDNLVRLHGSR